MAEFPSYSEQAVLSFPSTKLQVVYKEALRSRASKYTMLSQMINMHRYSDSSQGSIRDYSLQLLNPHFISEHVVDQKLIDDSWKAMRAMR